MYPQNGSIGDLEVFNPENYPDVITELKAMLTVIDRIPLYYKREIIISYLKDHSIKTNWMEANPELATLMVSGSLKTSSIEALFESCRWNKSFRSNFETYIKQKFH